MKRYALLDTDFISKTRSVQDDGGNHLIDQVMELPGYEFFCHVQIVTELNRYNKRYNALVERYDKLNADYDEICTLISDYDEICTLIFDNDARNEQMGRFITVLKEQDGVLTEFDEGLWGSLVEKLVVRTKTDVTVVFKDGTEIKAE